MTGPTSTPRGEHPGRPGAHWETRLVWTGEQLLDDDGPDACDDTPTTPRPNRATRRAATRRKNRRA